MKISEQFNLDDMLRTSENIYDELIQNTEALNIIEGDLLEAKKVLHQAKCKILVDNMADMKVLGNNEQAREATINEYLKKEYERVYDLESDKNETSKLMGINRLQLEYLKNQIDIYNTFVRLKKIEA
jgi:hypothetical protein